MSPTTISVSGDLPEPGQTVEQPDLDRWADDGGFVLLDKDVTHTAATVQPDHDADDDLPDPNLDLPLHLCHPGPDEAVVTERAAEEAALGLIRSGGQQLPVEAYPHPSMPGHYCLHGSSKLLAGLDRLGINTVLCHLVAAPAAKVEPRSSSRERLDIASLLTGLSADSMNSPDPKSL